MPLHLDEFQRDQLQGYIETVPAKKEYILNLILPEEPSYDINFAYGVVNGKFGDSASITGWNASAPLRDKKEIERAFGEVSKVQHGFRLDEKELLSFNRPRSEGEKGQVIDYVYNETDGLSQGVDDIAEYMRAKAIYSGNLVYEDAVNDIHVDVNFNIPSGNKLNITTTWEQAGSKPLTDIQTAIDKFKEVNQRQKPVVMHMSGATESKLLQNEQVRVQVYGSSNGGRIVTKDDLQNTFSALGLPPYQINDDVVIVNGAEEALLEDDKVVLIGEGIGSTMVGPTVENEYNPGKFVLPKLENDPPGQTIIVGKALFPAIKRPSAIVILSA